LRCPKAASQLVRGWESDSKDTQGGIGIPGSRPAHGGNILCVNLIMTGIDIKGQELASMLRLQTGAEFTIIPILASAQDLIVAVTRMSHHGLQKSPHVALTAPTS